MDYNPLPRITWAETQSAHIDWWAHERIERLGGTCATLPHPVRSLTPNLRLGVSCQAGQHDLCPTMPGRTVLTNPWRCACLCHYAAVSPRDLAHQLRSAEAGRHTLATGHETWAHPMVGWTCADPRCPAHDTVTAARIDHQDALDNGRGRRVAS